MPILVDLVRREMLVRYQMKVEYDEIVLFRHTQKDTDVVLKCSATIDDWTACQPIKAKYDYRLTGKTKTKILVVIVGHRIHGVFRVGATEEEGPRGEISNRELNRSYAKRAESLNERKMANEPAFRATLERVSFSKEDKPITGWRGREICTMAKSTGKLFLDIKVQ